MSGGTAALTAGDCGRSRQPSVVLSDRSEAHIFRSMNETMPFLRALRQTVANCPFDRVDLS